MADEVLVEASRGLRDIEPKIKRAEELVAAMADAGEDVSEWNKKLSQLRTRRDKWKAMFAKRGLA